MLAIKNTPTAIAIHTSWRSKNAFSTEKLRIVTSPRSASASADAKRNQSIRPKSENCFSSRRIALILWRGGERGSERNDVDTTWRHAEGIGPGEYDPRLLACPEFGKCGLRRGKCIAGGIKYGNDEFQILQFADVRIADSGTNARLACDIGRANIAHRNRACSVLHALPDRLVEKFEIGATDDAVARFYSPLVHRRYRSWHDVGRADSLGDKHVHVVVETETIAHRAHARLLIGILNIGDRIV